MKDKNTGLDRLSVNEHQEALDASRADAEPLEAHPSASPDALPVKTSKFSERTIGRAMAYRKKLAFGIVGALIVIATTVAVTDAKYGIMSLFLRADLEITVVDATTNQPVYEAAVSVGEVWARTDGKGMATLRGVPYGGVEVRASKFGYADTIRRSTITASGQSINLAITPAGLPVSSEENHKMTGVAIKRRDNQLR